MFHIRQLTLATLMIALPYLALSQQQTNDQPIGAQGLWRSGVAVHLIGYEGAAQGESGTLEIEQGDISFLASKGTARVDRHQIVAASEDDERRETGGAAGKVLRIAIPYGGGALLGAFSQKQVGLLTLDYRDAQGGFHSAVFVMAKTDAVAAAEHLSSHDPSDPTTTATAPGLCLNGVDPLALRVSAVQASPGVLLAPEYRAVLYEHLLELSAAKPHFDRVFRDGDPAGKCAPFVLSLQVERLSKGSGVTRTVSGPAGLFTSVTRLRVHAVVTDQSGRVLLDKVDISSKRGDTESLNAANSAAEKVAKSLKQVPLKWKHRS
jgi:hypothetical protein